MTVNELIAELNKIEDKTKVVFAMSANSERIAVTAIEDDIEQFIDILLEDAKDNTISIVWSIEDVTEQARKDGKEITEDQAREILQMMKDNHDCNFGITWETISAYIDILLEDAKRKQHGLRSNF
jgi:chromosomal replication initiation ATPase DnaA